jgi:acetoin utilization protein AcuB
MIVEQLIDSQVPTLEIGMSIKDCQVVFEKCTWNSLPVINKTELIGYISRAQINEVSTPILMGASFSGLVFYNHQHLYEIYPLMQSAGMDNVAVVSAKGEYIGVVSSQSIGKCLLNTLTYRGEGSIVLLKIFHTDFILSQLARIVEENNSKIVGMMIENIDNYYFVNLKINNLNIGPILQSFQRFAIAVEGHFSSHDAEALQKRKFDMALRHFDL